MKNFLAIAAAALLLCVGCSEKVNTPQQDRELWVEYLLKVADPVIRNTAEGTLKVNMPYEAHADKDTRPFSYLEAFGRTICGFAPWIESDEDDNTGRKGSCYKWSWELIR